MIPPELARMSGTTRTFLSARTASPSGVVGPLAPSTTNLARTPRAGCPVICPCAAATLPDPLHGARRPLQGDLLIAAELLDQVEDAASGGLLAAQAASDAHRLTGDHARLGVAPVHADRVHDPGHDPFIGPHVRGRAVPVRG